jgi:YNFM family putative membrane transporter
MYVDHASQSWCPGRARGRHCRLGEIASSLPVVAALRTVQGLVTASFSAVALAYVGEALLARWWPTGIRAMSTAFLSAGILGQVYAQAVIETLGWPWMFGSAAPALWLRLSLWR